MVILILSLSKDELVALRQAQGEENSILILSPELVEGSKDEADVECP